MKLFCLPHAGGNAAFFDNLRNELQPGNVKVCALDYPGHGTRRKEECADSIENLAKDMIAKIVSEFDGEEYAIFGYSMGCVVAAEVLRRIIKAQNILEPSHMILAAHAPKTLNQLRGINEGTVDDLLKQRTIAFGAVPESLINNSTFWRTYMPYFRSDYEMLSKFDFDLFDLQTRIPATILYSEEDTPFNEIVLWNNYFKGENKYVPYNGNHFFLKNNIAEIANLISNRLRLGKGD